MARTKAELEGELRRLKIRLRGLEREAERGRQAVAELRNMVGQLPCQIWTTDEELEFTSSAGAAVDNLPGAQTQIVGLTLYEYFGTKDKSFLPIAGSLRALKGDQIRHTFEWKDRHFLVLVGPLRSSRSTIVGTIGIALDITEQRRAELAHHESEHRYRDLFENANDILYTHDLEGRFTSINAAGQRAFEFSRAEILQRNISTLVSPECMQAMVHNTYALLGGGSTQYSELAVRSASGRRVLLEVSSRLIMENGQPTGVQAVARDITERKALEEQMRQTQKMEAIGVLAGGIAHDFNNLLTGILGYSYLLQNEPEIQRRHSEGIDVIVKSAERAAQLTTQLLGFARKGKTQNVAVDLHGILRDVEHLLHRTIDKQIHIAVNAQAARTHVLGDPNQLYQLLLNLCLNARDAMPAGGELRISTKIAGSNVILAVEDTGTGIPPEIQSRIFEPFFTTKEMNKGTGMGLAMVYGIAKGHGGTVHVESEVNQGTTFYVTLPTCEAASRLPDERASAESGRGRILVIDDEDVVRQVLSKMLRGLGYEVFTAGDSRQAIDYYRDHFENIDLVILDMIMPKMTGVACFSALRQINPRLRAVLVSGYTREGEANEVLKHSSAEYLQKPFQIEHLSAVVKRALVQSASQNA